MIHLDKKFTLLIIKFSNYVGFVVNYLVGDKFVGCWSVVGFLMSFFSFLTWGVIYEGHWFSLVLENQINDCLWIVELPKSKLVGSLKVKSKCVIPSRPLL
jgi:hypothetical protein